MNYSARLLSLMLACTAPVVAADALTTKLNDFAKALTSLYKELGGTSQEPQKNEPQKTENVQIILNLNLPENSNAKLAIENLQLRLQDRVDSKLGNVDFSTIEKQNMIGIGEGTVKVSYETIKSKLQALKEANLVDKEYRIEYDKATQETHLDGEFRASVSLGNALKDIYTNAPKNTSMHLLSISGNQEVNQDMANSVSDYAEKNKTKIDIGALELYRSGQKSGEKIVIKK